ncbi:MAG TPA: amidohydrolase family protein [Pirellulales bacterium]|jgi:N-acetylglucosamine-6-phosphate deacetylase|nr:amidohydrolase family protein [Pirellulales bacterium]
MQFVARRFDTLAPVRIEIAQGRIVLAAAAGPDGVGLTDSAPPDVARGLPIVAPGFIDVQVNGYRGQEFSSPQLTPQRVAAIVREHWAFGVSSLCPTLTTQSFDCLAHGMRTIDAACREYPEIGRSVAGIHLEGPYFDSEDGPRGAHPLAHCRRPCWDEFERLQEAAGGRIRILTMSPHFDDAPEFIARVAATGVVVAIGHTGADGRRIRAAVDAGARLSTHLGNGAHRMLRRHPNYLWDQLADDRLLASLIVDGHHLPGEVVKTMVRAKTPERCLLVSDVSGLAGLPPGRHASSGGDVEILADGRIVIAGQEQLLAGAALPIGVGVANVMRFAGVNLETAVHMASTHPARLLGRKVGSLRPGDAADLVLFDLTLAPDGGTRLDVRATIAAGEIVFGQVL